MNDRFSSYAKGVLGEAAAADYLESIGMTVIARRYRAGRGEIDLVLVEGNCLVFAEIKVREKASAEAAAFSVTKDKQRRMKDAACFFLAEHPEYAEFPCRFDVVTITGEGVHHYPNAFE